GPEFLRDVIEAVQKKYPVDSRRLYLFGHSGGASFGMYMGMLESQYFAAVAVHAGTLQKDSDVFTFAQRKIPIAIWSGTLDQFFPLDQVRSTRDILNSHGFRAQLFEMPGHDHDYYQVAGEVNKEAWAFLKQNILDEEPEWRDIKWSR
ncbi:MAG TPA: dienelactone hydrolase family protein, partial [Candidatus Angelobacter sp.]|nr:dienelactone hydrolase family protein [Candidatus Angelobacter sp.]